MEEVYIIDAKRTAVGAFNGSLAALPAHKLGELLISHLITKNALNPEIISEVIIGQVLTSGQGQNPARQALINAKIPQHVPAFTINQVCGSGLKAIALAAQSILLGDAKVVIAGGQENMSLTPHAINLRNVHKFGDAKLIDLMQFDGLTDAFARYSMGNTAENLATKYNISRLEQDEFAYNSQRKATLAQKDGKFASEILPIIQKKKNEEIIFANDEFIKPNSSLEQLASLKPAFLADGTVTAGNSSGINDGAALLLLMDKKTANSFNLKPMARIVSYADSGVDPSFMGIGPVMAVKKALSKAGWQIEDLELIEANEAFAAQAIAVNKELKWNQELVNVNGGAIAIGHPIGASGARILVSLIHEMQRRNAKKALATLCIGGGMGTAMCLSLA